MPSDPPVSCPRGLSQPCLLKCVFVCILDAQKLLCVAYGVPDYFVTWSRSVVACDLNACMMHDNSCFAMQVLQQPAVVLTVAGPPSAYTVDLHHFQLLNSQSLYLLDNGPTNRLHPCAEQAMPSQKRLRMAQLAKQPTLPALVSHGMNSEYGKGNVTALGGQRTAHNECKLPSIFEEFSDLRNKSFQGRPLQRMS